MHNNDTFLTIEEKQLLEESYENEKRGILVSSKDARKNLGVCENARLRLFFT